MVVSIKCSPGNTRMVVFSVISLSLPLRYENLADSINAQWSPELAQDIEEYHGINVEEELVRLFTIL